jgi:ligand-binding sensor domain-containing protein/signal transduction histidine kinase
MGIGFVSEEGRLYVAPGPMTHLRLKSTVVPHLLWLSVVAIGIAFVWSVRGATSELARYNVRSWQTDEGLPQNSVHAIAQTPDGYLWVGTHEGLARFDGVRFTLLDEPAAPYLRQSWITALCAGRDGSLWIASESNGVARLQAGALTQFKEADGLPGSQIQCLLESEDGSLWIGGDGGLARFKDGRITRFRQSERLINNSVKALFEYPKGTIRVATVTGLISVSTAGKEDVENFGLGVLTNVLKAVSADQRGQLWLGATDGLICLTEGKRVSYGLSHGLPDKIITVIHEDRAGQLWVGTYSGLVRFVDGRPVEWSLGRKPFADLIYTINEDREGSLWVGGRDGLYRLNPARLSTFTTEEGLNYNNVTSVLEDRLGDMWFGTWGGGVNRLHEGRFTGITTTNGLSHDTVLSLHEGRDASLWVGMDYNGVLNRLRAGLTNDFPRTATNGLINAAIRVIHEDRQGSMWIGTSKGLNRFHDGIYETYTTTNGLPGNIVMALCERADGSMWIGSDGGLGRWDGTNFASFTQRDGLSSDAVNALYEDRDHTLWIGTRTGGLNRYRDGKFTTYTTRQGLFSDEVYEIVEDDFGYFWMSCRRGIFRVSRKELDELDHGAIKLVHSTVFGKVDGLASVQCNGVSKPAGWKSRDGRLWFPTIRGVVAMEASISINDRPPPVVIEEVRAGRELLPLERLTNGATLKVAPGRGDLEIQYTALSLQVPEKVRFQYRLEPMDPEWVEAGAQRFAYYNSVPPGRYRFQVIACNNDGVWNETGAVLAIQMLPHYWQTWWFKTTAAAAFVILFVAFYRARVERLREIERLRIQIASDLHDDVGSRLTKVAMVTELVDRQTPPTDRSKTHIENISGTVREITRAMDEIVWTINPRNDTLDNLANYVFQYAQEYFQNTGVRCRLDVPAELPDHSISTEERHNLFMAVKEAFNNVLKHAGATEVRVGLTVAGNLLTIIIADNGRGISPDVTGPAGDGLANMKQRLQQIGGRFAFKSAPGVGTTITLEARGKWSV